MPAEVHNLAAAAPPSGLWPDWPCESIIALREVRRMVEEGFLP